MKLRSIGAVITLGLLLAACATTYTVTPIPSSDQQVRYQQGIPTTYSEQNNSAVQVIPYGLDNDSRLVFFMSAFNKGFAPENFGVEDISANANQGAVKVFTYNELVREAKDKATWAEIGIALTGVASAYAANENAYSTTSGSVYGPGGTSTFFARTYDPSAAYAGTAAASAATAYGMVQVQNSLDATLARLKGQLLQTTTIDPGTSFGGMMVLDSLSGDYPRKFTLAVNWGSDRHLFDFVVTKGDQVPPPIPPTTLAKQSAFDSPPRPSTEARAGSATKNLGVEGSSVSKNSSGGAGMPDPHGVFIQTVHPQSPAAIAGVKLGDIVVSFNDERVESIDDLNRYAQDSAPGSNATLRVWREGKITTLSLKL